MTWQRKRQYGRLWQAVCRGFTKTRRTSSAIAYSRINGYPGEWLETDASHPERNSSQSSHPEIRVLSANYYERKVCVGLVFVSAWMVVKHHHMRSINYSETHVHCARSYMYACTLCMMHMHLCKLLYVIYIGPMCRLNNSVCILYSIGAG